MGYLVFSFSPKIGAKRARREKQAPDRARRREKQTPDRALWGAALFLLAKNHQMTFFSFFFLVKNLVIFGVFHRQNSYHTKTKNGYIATLCRPLIARIIEAPELSSLIFRNLCHVSWITQVTVATRALSQKKNFKGLMGGYLTSMLAWCRLFIAPPDLRL